MRRFLAAARISSLLIFTVIAWIYADDTFNQLFSSGKYKEAIDYAEDKLPPGQRDADVWLKVAKANDTLGMTEKALACYLVAWRMNPNDYQALIGAAKVYNNLKEPDNALTMAKKALDINFNAEASWEYAKACISLNRPADALKALEKVIEADPSNAIANSELGNIYFSEKEFAKAIPLLRKAMNSKPDGEISFKIATCYRQTGAVDSAISFFKDALSRNVKVVESTAALADLNFEKKDYAAAQEEFESVVKFESGDAGTWAKLATCYERNNLKDKLAQADEKIVSLNPADTVSRLRLAQYADSRNDSRTALAMYTDLSSLTPKSPAVFHRLYELTMKNGAKSEAAAWLKRYIVLVPADADARRDLGDILYEQKDFDGALASYRAALKINPAIKGFYKRYAEIVSAKGQEDEVISALSGVIKSGEADVGTYTTLGLMYQKKQQYATAIGMYQKGLQIDPQNLDALTALASCQATAGNVKEAIVSYEQAVMMNPQASTEYRELGDLYMRQNATDEAMKAYKKYLDKAPGDAKVAQEVGGFSFDKKQYADAARYLAAVRGRDNDIDMMYGEASLRSGNAKEAIAAFESVKERKPRNIRELLDLLAQSYELNGQNEIAGRTYGEYVKLPGVHDADASYKHGFMAETSAPTEAAKIYEANIKEFPGDYRNYLRLGLLYSVKQETLEKSVSMLRQTAELADSVPSVWLELGKVYGKLGQTGDQVSSYKRYLQKDAQNLEANKQLGIILVNKGQITDGLVYLETANALSPNDPEIMAGLAKGYVKTGRAIEAVDLLIKAKAAMKDNPDIRFELLDLYLKSGQKQKALDELKGLAGINKAPKYQLMYADALCQAGNFADAQGAIEVVLATQPDNIDALMLQAKIQRSQQKYDDAIETYKEISNINENHAPSICARADTYLEQSKPQWAETFYKRTLEVDPKYALAELGLARVAMLLNDPVGYQQHLENARRLAPDNDQILQEIQKSHK